jgi:hypothetical protein
MHCYNCRFLPLEHCAGEIQNAWLVKNSDIDTQNLVYRGKKIYTYERGYFISKRQSLLRRINEQ